MTRKISLVERVSAGLRETIAGSEVLPGDRLPTETKLAEQYGVSRPTVRAALRELESHGLVRTQHGVGTFVADRPHITAGLERLDSMTESIRATGRTPGMEYKSRVVRPLLPEEAAKLDLPGDALALEIRRSILADAEVVAYSYDLIPLGIFPEESDPASLTGSIFRYLREERGITPVRSIAEIHAVTSSHIGWGAPGAHGDLYLLLAQVHYDESGAPLMFSRSYFIEGRYSFTVHRHA